MAAPIVTAATAIAKRLIFDLFTDPEKFLKTIFSVIIIPLTLIILFFGFPIVFAVSVPTLMVYGQGDSASNISQMQKLSIYQQAPEELMEINKEWIEQQKRIHAGYDDLAVQVDMNLTWQQLIAIDAVRLDQDFSKANHRDIINLAHQFIERSVYTETYEEEESYIDPITKEEKSETVTRTRLIIDIKTKPLDSVMNELGFGSFEKQVANNIFSTLLTSINGSTDIGNMAVSDNVLQWKAQIEEAASKYNVDPALIAAVIHQESGGNPGAMSPVGAIGLMQLMPGTASDMGVDPFDPLQNIDGGTHYLAILSRSFDLQDTIAAYNAGPGNVISRRWVTFSETVNYVARVQQLYQLYQGSL